LTVVFKMENNTANVRLKEKDSDVYLNDQIIAKLWAQVNAPVVQITQPALEVSKPRLKVATPKYYSQNDHKIQNKNLITLCSELNQIGTVPRVDLLPKRPEKELYSAPKAKKIISDWDDPSNNFFADKKNPDNHSTQVGGNSQPVTINKQFSIDVPDRSNLKRVSDSSDDWTSKRSHPPRDEFLQPPPPMKAFAGEKFSSFDKLERKMSFGNGSSNRSESANRGRDNDRRDNRGGQGHQWRSGSGDRQGQEDRFDNSRGSTGGSKFKSWGDKSKGGSDYQPSGNRSDQKSNQDFQGAASQEKWKPRTQETQGGTTMTGTKLVIYF
jgi:hypothetical protein